MVLNKKLKRFRRSRRGQSLVEIAISMPILVLVFSGVIDFGRAYFSWVELNSAVSEGSHWAAIYPVCIQYIVGESISGSSNNCQNSNAIQERILNEDGLLNRNNFSCVLETVTNGPGTVHPGPGDTVQIQVEYKVTPVTPIFSAIINTFNIQATTQETIRGGATDKPSVGAVSVPDQGGITSGCSIP